MKKHIPYILLVAIAIFVLATTVTQAQTAKKVVQVSGIVITGDSAHGVPGAYLYVPKTGRGTSTNHIGYFSLPALVGDTLIIKAIGFRQKIYVVPPVDEKTSIIVRISADAQFLPMVEVFPWPTEQLFKEAFLALELDQTHKDYAARNLNDVVMRRMLLNLPDDGSMNHKYFINQQYMNRPGAGVQNFSILDPFAWQRFLQSTKNGSLKAQEDKYKDAEEDDKR